MYLTISKICSASSRSVLSKTTVRSLMPEPQSYANGTIAFAKIHIILESSILLAKKIKKSWNYMEEKRKMSIFLKATRA